jgi:site-specific recombinase XerD
VATYLEERAGGDPQQPLFRNWRGKPITIQGVQHLMSQYASESGVAVTCHRLRHTFGRWMAEGEMPVLTLSRLLGHASPNTTQRYIDGADPQTRRSYEAAMGCSLSSETKSPVEKWPDLEIRTTGPAKVKREPPKTFYRDNWMPDAPIWLRESCLDWVEHWWYTWKPSRRQHHVRTYLGEVRRFWEWQLDRRTFASWQELTNADVAAFADAQLNRGLKAKTVRTTLDRVFGVLRFLKERGRLSEIPERPEVKLPDPLPQHLKADEILALEENVVQLEQTSSPEAWLDIALYVLLMHTGLRIGEALDLQVKDLDLTAGRILVREGKGRRDRVVYLTQKSAERLARYLQTVSHAAGDLVLSWQEEALSYNRAWRRVRRLGEAAGVEGVGPQRLRHTYATLLLNNGMSLEGLRRLMGHENINTTLIYSRLANRTIEQQYHAAMHSVTNG